MKRPLLTTNSIKPFEYKPKQATYTQNQYSRKFLLNKNISFEERAKKLLNSIPTKQEPAKAKFTSKFESLKVNLLISNRTAKSKPFNNYDTIQNCLEDPEYKSKVRGSSKPNNQTEPSKAADLLKQKK